MLGTPGVPSYLFLPLLNLPSRPSVPPPPPLLANLPPGPVSLIFSFFLHFILLVNLTLPAHTHTTVSFLTPPKSSFMPLYALLSFRFPKPPCPSLFVLHQPPLLPTLSTLIRSAFLPFPPSIYSLLIPPPRITRLEVLLTLSAPPLGSPSFPLNQSLHCNHVCAPSSPSL